MKIHIGEKTRRRFAGGLAALLMFNALPMDHIALAEEAEVSSYSIVEIEEISDKEVEFGTPVEKIGLPDTLQMSVEEEEETETVETETVETETIETETVETETSETETTESETTESETAEMGTEGTETAEKETETAGTEAYKKEAESTKETSSEEKDESEEKSKPEEKKEVVEVSAPENMAKPEETEVHTMSESHKTTIDIPVEWNCSEYHENLAGEYTFTASLTDDTYEKHSLQLAEGVEMPEVIVTVLPETELILTQTVDDIEITVKADPGVFPEKVTLSVSKVEKHSEIESIDEAISEIRDEERKVSESHAFDIKIEDEEENEIEPDTSKGNVQVSFAMAKVLDENRQIDVYHVKDEEDKGGTEAESLMVEKEEVTPAEKEDVDKETVLTVETDSFSYYVVEFTVGDLEYVLDGDSSIPLSTILETLQMTGVVTDAKSSDDSLFTVTKDETENDWTVEAVDAFSSNETLTVTINDVEYEIAVTDGALIAYFDYNGNLSNKISGSGVTITENCGTASRGYSSGGAGTDNTYLYWNGASGNGYDQLVKIPGQLNQYSFALRFSYGDALSSYKSICNFTDNTSDNGFYFCNNKIGFYLSGFNGGTTNFASNQVIDLIVTRDSSGTFTIYSKSNGVFTKEKTITGTDSYSLPAYVSSYSRMHFFCDNGSELTTSGSVYSLKIWNYVLSNSEIQSAGDPIAVTYKNADGTIRSTIAVTPGGSHVVTSALTSAVTGTTFAGWRGNNGVLYQSGNSITNIQTAITLTAEWKYAVNYDVNSGDAGSTPAAQSKTHNTALTITSSKPTKDGYTFMGWNTSMDGSGTSYASNTSYTINAPLTLYAMWVKTGLVYRTNSSGTFYSTTPSVNGWADPFRNNASASYLWIDNPTSEAITYNMSVLNHGYSIASGKTLIFTSSGGGKLTITSNKSGAPTLTNNGTLYIGKNVEITRSTDFGAVSAATGSNTYLEGKAVKNGSGQYGIWYGGGTVYCLDGCTYNSDDGGSNVIRKLCYKLTINKGDGVKTVSVTNYLTVPYAATSVKASGSEYWYATGTTASISAVPETNYRLNGGTGDYVITENKTIAVTASFLIKKMEIRKDSATGDTIADLLENSFTEKLATGKDYYLYVELTDEAVGKYVELKYGNTGGNNSATANGVTYANVPGGTYTKGNISHTYFDQLIQYTDFANPAYGSGTAKLALQDGTLVYHIKDTKEEGSTINFAVGLNINDALYDGSGEIEAALKVAIKTKNGSDWTYEDSVTSDLEISSKNELMTKFVTSTSTAVLDGVGNTVQVYAVCNNTNDQLAAVLFDNYTMDITYPKGAELEYGFDTSFNKKNTTYGTMSVSAPVATGTNDTYGHALQKTTVTITGGFKALLSTICIYYRLNFAAGTFAPGKYEITGSRPQITMKNGTVITMNTPVAYNMKTTYTVSEGGLDATSMSAMNRTAVYNQTVSQSSGKYMTQLGAAYIRNANGSEATPYDKTYEAEFNTTDAAANISLITVPLGTSEEPVIHWYGKDSGGSEKDGILTEEQVGDCANVKGKISSSTYLMIYAKDLGIETFTKVSAEIGKLPSAYSTSGWTSGWSFSYNRAGAFGYFTTDDDGIVVENSYHLFNTDETLRDQANGDLMISSKATATLDSRAGLYTDQMRLGTANLNSASSVKAGEIAKINGRIIPYSVPGAAYDKSSGSTVYATTTQISKPVFYLTLPQGITLSTENNGVSFYKYICSDRGSYVGKESLSYESVQVGNIVNGITKYKITVKGDNTTFGYYDENGQYSYLYYTVSFKTDKSLETQRYRLNDLITVVSGDHTTAMPYANINSGTLNNAMKDIYSFNDGNKVFGIAKDTDSLPVGFGVQQLATIAVSTSMSVSKIDSMDIPEEEQEWYSYDISNPNSVAMLGKTSAGRLQLQIRNTSETGRNFVMVLPIPKKGEENGTLFADGNQEFTISMTDELTAGSASGFQVAYGKINGSYTNAAGFFTAGNSYTTDGITEATANALIITADSLANGNYSLYLDYTVESGEPGSTDIWRPVYQYQIGAGSNAAVNRASGGFVASAIAETQLLGIVFNDTDKDGVKDAGEETIPGVGVTIQDGQGRMVHAVTDSHGSYSYSFKAIRESAITVTFTTEQNKVYRFNIAPQTTQAGIYSSIIPAANGLSAARTLYASGESIEVDAAMSGFLTVSYDGNQNSGGSAPAVQEYSKNNTVSIATKADNLVKTGYKFMGWNTRADGSGTNYQPGNTFIMGDTNVTLYANWQIASYLVTFNYRGATGGNTEGSRTVAYNNYYGGTKSGNTFSTSLPSPIKTGYTFVGWTTSATAATRNVTDATLFKTGANTILYAVWKAKTGFSVQYDGNGAAETIPSKTGVTWTDASLLPETIPARDGYIFAGWKCGTKKVTDETDYRTLASGDTDVSITMTAAWTVRQGYSVNYEGNGSTDLMTPKEDVSWTDTGLLPAVNPTRQGYAFAGWTVQGDIISDYVSQNQSFGELAEQDTVSGITLIAQWNEIQDNIVSYYTAGGTSIMDKNGVKSSDSHLLPDENPTKTGYDFAGWYAGRREVTEDTIYSELTLETTLTLSAKWTEKNYTIRYDSNGSADSFSDLEHVKFTDYDLLPNTEPVRNGYIFLGWYAGENKINYSHTVESLASEIVQAVNAGEEDTLDLTARWQEKTYTLIYNSDGGTYFTPKNLVNYTDFNLLPDTQPLKKGYDFAGWYTSGAGTGAASDVENLLTQETKLSEVVAPAAIKITFTAHWTPKAGYKVTYNTNGGTYVAAKENVKWTDANLLPAVTPVRVGYRLTGWTIGRKTVNTATAYAELTQDDAVSGITLVAVWEENASYKIRYKTGTDRTISDLNDIRWTQSRLLPNVTLMREGYAFKGWKNESGLLIQNDDTYSMAAGEMDKAYLTLTAAWEEKNQYMVIYDTNEGGAIATKNNVAWTNSALLPKEVPVKMGYQFTGWYVEDMLVKNSSTFETLANILGVDDTITSITLSAHWRAKTYTIAYDTDGAGNIESLQNYPWNLAGVTPDTKPVKEGYTFDGWTYGNQTVSSQDALADFMKVDTGSTITLKAAWKINTYTVRLQQEADPEIIMEAVEGSRNPVEYTGSYSFIITPADGYSKTEQYHVTVRNAAQAESQAEEIFTGEEGFYFLADVKADMIVSVSGIADVTAPDVQVQVGKNRFNSFLNTITFGYFFKETQRVTIETTDLGSGVGTVQYYAGTAQMTTGQLQILTVTEDADTGWKTYSGSFNLEPDCKRVLYVRATDATGNAAYVSSDGMLIDGTAPVITGVEDGHNYTGSQTITVTDFDRIVRLTVNGEEMLGQLQNGSLTLIPAADPYQIQAADRLGNIVSYTHVLIEKATPIVTAPTEFTVNWGTTLAEIALPDDANGHYEWMVDEATNVGNIGDHVFKLKYIPDDTVEYRNVENLAVTVHVTEISQPAPEGVEKHDETVLGRNDGKITGLTTQMEYSDDNGFTWTAITETTLTGLTPGTYQVRLKAVPAEHKLQGVPLTLVIEYGPVESNVILHLNGGVINGAITKYLEGYVTVLPQNISRDGYVFAGWYPSAMLSGNAVTAIGALETGDKEYWANWELKKSSGGKKGNGGTIWTITKEQEPVKQEATKEEEPVVTPEQLITEERTAPDLSSVNPVGYEENKSKPVTEPVKVKIGEGAVTIYVESLNEEEKAEGDVITGVVLSKMENVISSTLTPEEQKKVEGGEDISIRLIVKKLQNKVPEEAKTSIEEVVKNQALEDREIEDMTIGGYIDLSVEKKVGNGNWERLSNLNDELSITIDIPESMRRENAKYWVIKDHEGNITILKDLDDNPDTVTIRTKEFSTYAIAFSTMENSAADSKIKTELSDGSSQATEAAETETSKADTKDTKAAAGIPFIWLILVLAAVAGGYVWYQKKN